MLRKPLLGLTGLRFIAALGVLLFHLWRTLLPGLGAPAWMQNLANSGYIGVNLFFILSGFVLVYAYLEPNGEMRGTQRQFYWARFARIYPVYFLALLLMLPFEYGNLREGGFLAPVLLQSWVPVGGATAWNAPGWTLSVEAFFYVLFPFLLPLVSRVNHRVLVTACITAWFLTLVPVLAYVALAPDGIGVHASTATQTFWGRAIKVFPLFRLGEFLLGMLVGRWFISAPAFIREAKRVWGVAALGTGAVILLILASGAVPYILLHAGIIDLLFALLILTVALDQGRLTAWLRHPHMVLLGDASYALYLLHIAVSTYAWTYGVQLLRPLGPVPTVAVVTAVTFVSVILSVVCYQQFEVPAKNFLRRAAPYWRKAAT